MERLIIFFIICKIILSTSLCSAQNKPFNTQPFQFCTSQYTPYFLVLLNSTQAFSARVSVADFTLKKTTANSLTTITPLPYTSFFCKMEIKVVNHFGVWIKIHAGDYDSYNNQK